VIAVIPGEEELGSQKRCGLCHDWYPLGDPAFWYREGNGWAGWCRACWAERQREYRLRRRQDVG
jgi:hypothetical protein